MFVIFVLLWLIALLLIYANPKTPWAWWASSCLFLNGFGGVAVIFKDNIIPFVEGLENPELEYICTIGKGIADVFQHYFATYALIGFILLLTNFLDYKLKRVSKILILLILSVPSILMCFLYPLTPNFEPDYKILSAWVVVYTGAADLIMLISAFKEKDSAKKYQKILASVFTIPTSLSIMWTSYLSVAMGFHEIWYLNVWIILFQFVVFIFMAAKYGVLGVRLRVERHNLDETIDTMINGMSMVSHAIKNEASTINLCVDTIRALDQLNPGTVRKLAIIKDSCKNLSDITQSINKFRTLELDLEPYVLDVLIDKVINQVFPLINDKEIQIVNKCKQGITIVVDAVHISEVIRNLLINAIESIDKTGIIAIETELLDERFCVSVADNGIGIPPDLLDKILTPFYSTKKGKNNFGLGLSYCYKVMKSHNGSIKVNSKLYHGTRMSLLFPAERILKV